MKTLYYDCFAGISGDMNLGALVDAGADAAELERRLQTLGVGGWRLEISRESRLGIFGTRVHVALDSGACEGAENFGHTHSEGCAHSHRDHEHSYMLVNIRITTTNIFTILTNTPSTNILTTPANISIIPTKTPTILTDILRKI